MLTFPSKDFSESITLDFNFESEVIVDNLLSAEIFIDTAYGFDGHPGKVLVGPPRVSGYVVSQSVTGGEPSAIYRLTCKARVSDGRILILTAHLPISGYVNDYTETYLTNP